MATKSTGFMNFFRNAAGATAGTQPYRPAVTPTTQPARTTTVPSPVAAPAASSKDGAIASIVAQLIKARKRVPIYLLSTGLEPGVIPVDTEAEVGRSVVSHILAEGEMSPAGSVSASLAGTGSVELACPAGSIELGVPAIVLQFATTTDGSQPGPITGSVLGSYSGPTKFAVGAGGAAELRDNADGSLHDFKSGVFEVTPRTLGEKHTMVILPYQIVNSRTYLRPLAVSEAGVKYQQANKLQLTITGAPDGLLTTIGILTVQHAMYRDVIDAISAD